MSGHGQKFARKRDAAIAALLSRSTVKAAARAVGVGETTLLRWLQEPEFQTAYRAARRQVVEAAIAKLQRAAGEAVDALRRNLKVKGRPSVQVAAARTILDHAIRAVELLDLAERIEALEAITRKDKVNVA